jgi:hypothetical protein
MDKFAETTNLQSAREKKRATELMMTERERERARLEKKTTVENDDGR